jgi:NAD(P)H dehydrogenase (quinone)
LAGDDSFTLSDLAAELSRRTGRRISYKDLPEAEYASFLEQNGLAGGYARALASWDVGISAGALFDDGRRLGRLIGRRTVTIRDFVGATLGEDLADTG